jgi:hypothetical protein
VRSKTAIGVGVFFTLVTCYVLFEDVVRHQAPITPKHIMTLAVLAGTIYFGHRLWPELRALSFGTALGCAVLFVAGTATCVIMSAGRNTEVSLKKASEANKVNAGRKRLDDKLSESKRALKAAEEGHDRALIEAKAAYKAALDGTSDLNLGEAKKRYDAALTAEQTECSSGAGAKCRSRKELTTKLRADLDTAEKGNRLTIELRRADVEKAEAQLLKTIEQRRADVATAEALLRLAPPEQVANADIKAAAGLLAKLPYVTADVAKIEHMLLLFFPFMLALFCEIGAIVGFSIGIGHRAATARKPNAGPHPENRRKPRHPGGNRTATILTGPWRRQPASGKPMARADCLAYVQAELAAGRPIPSQDELAAHSRVRKGTVSKWLKDWESDGLLARTRSGRRNIISGA